MDFDSKVYIDVEKHAHGRQAAFRCSPGFGQGMT
jgi:hypothetical protein